MQMGHRLACKLYPRYWGPASYAMVCKSQMTMYTSKDGGQLAYLQDNGALSSADVKDWAGLVPAGVNSILMCQGATSSGSGMLLVLLSDRPRAWSRRERLWGLAVTKKLENSMH